MKTFNPRRILEILAEHGVEYIVVGGIGGVLHGSPLQTTDVDIVPSLGKSNLDALAIALNVMNARIMSHETPDGLKVDFTGKNLQRWIIDFRFLNLMTDYGQLDVIYRPGGTDGFRDIAEKAENLEIGSVQVRVASLEDIIRSKQAVARERDLEQLPTLRLVLEQKRSGIRPGQVVSVPWELDEKTGTVIDIRGVGPSARASVLVQIDEGQQEELVFPVSVLRAVSS
jgi:hypothetical protein